MEPYSYVITWYPTEDQVTEGKLPEVLAHGFVVADSQLAAFVEVLDRVPKAYRNDVEQVELIAKPVVEEKTICSGKDELFNYFNYMIKNIDYITEYTISNSNNLDSEITVSYNMKLPKKLMVVEVLAILNDKPL